MNTKLAITVTLVAFLALSLLGQALAQTRVPGVNPQDTFTYSIVTHWSSDNASEIVPSSLIGLNQTKEYKVMIGGVTDAVNVTSTNVWQFSNGTEYDYLLTIDVQSGTPYYLSGTQPPFEGIVGANLNAGDLLHPSGNDSIAINQTVNRDYAGGSRQTNVVDLNSPIQNQTTDSNNQTILQTIGYQDVTYYIDRETGMLVGQNSTIQSIIPNKDVATVIWTLTSTNRWDASPAMGWLEPVIIVAVVVVVIVVAAVVIFKPFKKGGKKRR